MTTSASSHSGSSDAIPRAAADGPDRWRVLWAGLTLTLEWWGKHLRIHDESLALILGYKRMAKLRQLIDYLADARVGILCGVGQRPVTGKLIVGPGLEGVRRYSVTEYWLTLEEALRVASDSGSPRRVTALEWRFKIVGVFFAVPGALEVPKP